jgi:D-ribose pyranase
MKRSGILNAQLSETLATLGHTDLIMVVDAGFPIPRDAHRIDLAIAQDLPDVRTVLSLIHREIIVEKVARAEYVVSHNPTLDEFLATEFSGAEFVVRPHEEILSQMAHEAKAIVRTGAYDPWGNIGLYCGVDVPTWFAPDHVTLPDYYADRK